MNTTEPSVSVLIPCYNRAAYIRQVVHAILHQTRPPEEIIVVDDASTDESVNILQQLPVGLLQHENNRGPGVTRNTALKAASGDIVLFIDADAYAETHLIEVLLRAYQRPSRHPVGGIGGRGVESNIQTVYDRWRALHARQDFGNRPRDNVSYLFGLCASYKREVLQALGGFDPIFPTNAGEDLDLGYRLIRQGYRLHYTPQAIVYHQHQDTVERLRRVQYNWYYWSYLAKKRSGFHPWTLFAGTIRRLFTDTLTDLLIRRDLELARIDLEISGVKISALRAASRNWG